MARFADIDSEYTIAKCKFEDEMDRCSEYLHNNYTDWFCDDYDGSIEFKNMPNDFRASEELQEVWWSNGFVKAYINHENGWETHYNPRDSKGWRKRQWKRKDTDGTIEVEVFPASWPKEWLESGYVTVVGQNEA